MHAYTNYGEGAVTKPLSSALILSSSPPAPERLSVVLRVLARLLCHGVISAGVPVLGVDGLEPVGVSRVGLPALAIPTVEVAPFFLRLSDVLPVVLLLHRLCRSSRFCFTERSSRSGVGVVLRDEERECEPSRPLSLRRLARLFLFKEF